MKTLGEMGLRRLGSVADPGKSAHTTKLIHHLVRLPLKHGPLKGHSSVFLVLLVKCRDTGVPGMTLHADPADLTGLGRRRRDELEGHSRPVGYVHQYDGRARGFDGTLGGGLRSRGEEGWGGRVARVRIQVPGDGRLAGKIGRRGWLLDRG